MRLAPLILIALLSGCAVVFQGPCGKKCTPSWSHVCKTILDLDE